MKKNHLPPFAFGKGRMLDVKLVLNKTLFLSSLSSIWY